MYFDLVDSRMATYVQTVLIIFPLVSFNRGNVFRYAAWYISSRNTTVPHHRFLRGPWKDPESVPVLHFQLGPLLLWHRFIVIFQKGPTTEKNNNGIPQTQLWRLRLGYSMGIQSKSGTIRDMAISCNAVRTVLKIGLWVKISIKSNQGNQSYILLSFKTHFPNLRGL